MHIPRSLFSLFILLCLIAQRAAGEDRDTDSEMIEKIFAQSLTESKAYGLLETLTRDYGGRLSGSENLEGAIVWARGILDGMGLDKVWLQPVEVPHWERGDEESAQLFANGDPHGHGEALTLCALGGSVATAEEGILANVVEVKSLEELENLGREVVEGKIVFFNGPMDATLMHTPDAYHDAVPQRTKGPSAAGSLGAIAVLVRSMTLAMDDVPHTGALKYKEGAPKIPAAALSTLSAERLSTAIKEDKNARVRLALHCRTLPDALSHNVIGEVKGSEFPDKIILVGGHIDSWDITPGAHDDGAGCVQSMEAIRLLMELGYKPRHTLRVVLFTNEENGARGAKEYAKKAEEEKEIHLAAIESDSGGFAPRGFSFGSEDPAVVEKIASWKPLLEPYGLHKFTSGGDGGTDVKPLKEQGAAVIGLVPESARYFDYHHTAIDTLDKVNKRELELGVGAIGSLIYLIDRHGL